MVQLTLGVMARSLKENERRLPLHPKHVDRIPEELRGRVFLETGYGERQGVSDAQLEPFVGGFRSREQLVAECDVILAPKPLLQDISGLRAGQVLWGWPHCVQDSELTQVAIDRQLTIIAFEAMNHWNDDGSFGLHVFHKNNELAGYCSVLHAFQIAGITGDYRHWVRRHRPRSRDRPQGARRQRGRRDDPAAQGGGGVTDPLGADRALLH